MNFSKEIFELIERFNRNREAYISGQYNETQLRREFIDPFFELLGWDVNNKQGYAEAYKDVIHEDAIKIGSATKAPDYCFRIGGTRKFFVEAKKPSVNLKDDVNPAFQLRRYAWSAKLPLSILTDFEEFAVYDCRITPVKTDKASTARILYLTYKEYDQRWDEIASIFSREAILKGSFDKYAETGKHKRGTAEVDDAFLKEIESWRDMLARNIALRNPELTQRELNFAVQRTIDRIIFLRICEDRGVEEYGRLMSLMNGANVYRRLLEIFRYADEKYNSGLFHFQKEKERHELPDELTPILAIDDKHLKDIIKRLYYPESPYEFSVLPADILGQVYEQFLGKVIRLTSGHRAIVEEKPEVRKAGGVYYTPTYIVDYIVKNTVGKLLGSDPLPKVVTPKDVSKLRILDPACGSGSFLLGAYQYLLDWHRDWYVNDSKEKWATGKNPSLYQAQGGDWHLTTSEKKRILLNNIYGVDIDSQAVEVTKLSLLLKVLEGENNQTIEKQLKFYHERALPDLGDNIKCGNSLIGTDFYNMELFKFPQNQSLKNAPSLPPFGKGGRGGIIDDEERFRINAFDWEKEFPAIIKSGGFDAVIGNPPWGASFIEPELAYLRKKYKEVVARTIDSYIYFIASAFKLIRRTMPVGFIIPSTILNQVEAKPVRDVVLKRGLTTLINMGQGIFGTKVLNTSSILISAMSPSKKFVLANLANLPLQDRPSGLDHVNAADWKEWKNLVGRDPHLTFSVADINATALLEKLRRKHVPLSNLIQGTIQRGVSPDVVAAHVISKAEVKSETFETDLLRPSISGSQIKRYREWAPDQFIIYTTRDTQLKHYPRIAKYLEQFRHQNTCKEVSDGKHPWWALHRPRDPQIFASPKFVGLTTSKTIELIYDPDSSVFVTDAMYVFSTVEGIDPWAFMAIMQSKLFLFLYKVSNQGESRVIPQVKASKLDSLPFPVLNSFNPQLSKLNDFCKQMYKLNRQKTNAKTDHEKTALQRQLDATDKHIDQLVYELYGLTEEEIKIVEGLVKTLGKN